MPNFAKTPSYLPILVVFLVKLLGAGPTQSSDGDTVTPLIQQLGDDRYVYREKAASKLLALGEEALPALRRAGTQEHGSLEIRRRAQALTTSILEQLRKGRSTAMELCIIPAGEFLMGSPAKERGRQLDECQHRVKLTQSYLLGACEVTQDVYHQVMKYNPSYFCAGGDGKNKVANQDTLLFPVENVSWFDAIDFCNRLSQREGFGAYYKLADVTRKGNSIAIANVTIAGGNGYRLPTEAEWEYACRAGSETRFHYGYSTSGNQANLKYSLPGLYGSPSKVLALERTEKGGKYKANAWGLFDMHGNIAEWCWDYYEGNYYKNSPESDPPGPDRGIQRIIRGGSWLVSEENGRSASRFWQIPGEGTFFIGFRVARTPKQLEAIRKDSSKILRFHAADR